MDSECSKALNPFFLQKVDHYYNELNKRKNCYGSYLTPLTVKGCRKGQNR